MSYVVLKEKKFLNETLKLFTKDGWYVVGVYSNNSDTLAEVFSDDDYRTALDEYKRLEHEMWQDQVGSVKGVF